MESTTSGQTSKFVDAMTVKTNNAVVDEHLNVEPKERRRVLNVLAQRRYRRRKKERQAMLEDMVGQTTNSADATTEPRRQSPCLGHVIGLTLGDMDNKCRTPLEPFLGLRSRAFTGSPDYLPTSSENELSSELLSSWTTLTADDYTNDTQSNGLTNTISDTSLSDLLQSDELKSATFPDDYYLKVSSLDLLRAAFEIATRLHSTERLWDLTAGSVFLEPNSAIWALELPTNLQPTPTQCLVPHHPLLDLLPWPSVRTKLINMYTLPTHFWPRHPVDGMPCSMVRFIYDLEDDGVHIWGCDPTDVEAWEVQESFVAAWWWALDQDVFMVANRRRRIRGDTELREPGV